MVSTVNGGLRPLYKIAAEITGRVKDSCTGSCTLIFVQLAHVEVRLYLSGVDYHSANQLGYIPIASSHEV
ncbi:hypothetical protein SLA2020_467830 [Shorea laevis]